MSSTQCACSLPKGSVGAILTDGIQDVSPLLPLLGTEPCEVHASCALSEGYLYVAATPMCLFGSLGLARAGLKTFIASLNQLLYLQFECSWCAHAVKHGIPTAGYQSLVGHAR
jgi:hypothetical protein